MPQDSVNEQVKQLCFAVNQNDVERVRRHVAVDDISVYEAGFLDIYTFIRLRWMNAVQVAVYYNRLRIVKLFMDLEIDFSVIPSESPDELPIYRRTPMEIAIDKNSASLPYLREYQAGLEKRKEDKRVDRDVRFNTLCQQQIAREFGLWLRREYDILATLRIDRSPPRSDFCLPMLACLVAALQRDRPAPLPFPDDPPSEDSARAVVQDPAHEGLDEAATGLQSELDHIDAALAMLDPDGSLAQTAPVDGAEAMAAWRSAHAAWTDSFSDDARARELATATDAAATALSSFLTGVADGLRNVAECPAPPDGVSDLRSRLRQALIAEQRHLAKHGPVQRCLYPRDAAVVAAYALRQVIALDLARLDGHRRLRRYCETLLEHPADPAPVPGGKHPVLVASATDIETRLADWAADASVADIAEAAGRVARDLFAGLAYLHRCGQAHGSVDDAHIGVVKSAHSGRVRLVLAPPAASAPIAEWRSDLRSAAHLLLQHLSGAAEQCAPVVAALQGCLDEDHATAHRVTSAPGVAFAGLAAVQRVGRSKRARVAFSERLAEHVAAVAAFSEVWQAKGPARLSEELDDLPENVSEPWFEELALCSRDMRARLADLAANEEELLICGAELVAQARQANEASRERHRERIFEPTPYPGLAMARVAPVTGEEAVQLVGFVHSVCPATRPRKVEEAFAVTVSTETWRWYDRLRWVQRCAEQDAPDEPTAARIAALDPTSSERLGVVWRRTTASGIAWMAAAGVAITDSSDEADSNAAVLVRWVPHRDVTGLGIPVGAVIFGATT